MRTAVTKLMDTGEILHVNDYHKKCFPKSMLLPCKIGGKRRAKGFILRTNKGYNLYNTKKEALYYKRQMLLEAL